MLVFVFLGERRACFFHIQLMAAVSAIKEPSLVSGIADEQREPDPCSPPRLVGHKEHFLISVPSDQPFFCQHPHVTPTPLMGVPGHPINHSSRSLTSSLCVCTMARRRLKTLSPAFPSEVIIRSLGYSWACQILFLASLNTPNKRREAFATAILPFTLLSLRALRDYTHRWFEFGPGPPHANIRHALNLSPILMDGGAGGGFADS